MCEANVYYKDGDNLKKLMEAAFIISKEGDKVYFQNIFGEQEFVKGKIKEMDLIKHEVIIEKGE